MTFSNPFSRRSEAELSAMLHLPAPRARIGEMLVQAGLITQAQLNDALHKQELWGSRVGDIVLAMGWVKPQRFYRVLANHFGLDFVNLVEEPVDDSLFNREEYADYAQHLYLPWKRKGDELWVATAEPGSKHLRRRWVDEANVRFVVTSKFDIIWELQRVAGAEFSEQALHDLVKTDPERSASVVMTPDQKRAGVLFILILVFFLLIAPILTLIVLNAAVHLFLLFGFLFRTALCWISCDEHAALTITDKEIEELEETGLPVYTVLVPMYKEPAVLPILAHALRNMDYPRSKLDIKLVLEENDFETIAAAKALALDATFEIVRVPHSEPKTKPKACNYALRLARGKYLTIYDAEDKPEPKQLKKAVAAFRRMGDKTACVQARLNYFNASENWLTRMFTLEYSLWFDMFLPALDRLRIPIPLGGTSNHFDIEKLRAIGAWDPYNVTEDADLGLRFAALGYRVRVVDSITYEEANSHLGNWIRQRSRWLKGYMQTWLVNMRHPIRLYKKVGASGFCSLQLFVGATIVSALAYPFMFVCFLLWVLLRTNIFHPIYPYGVIVIGVVNLAIGNSCLLYLSMLGVAKRKNYWLMPHALSIPVYWSLQAIAAYKGLYQLVWRPFYWEKTNHGISKFTKAEVLRATSAG